MANSPEKDVKTLTNVLIAHEFAKFMIDRPELFERTQIPCHMRACWESLVESREVKPAVEVAPERTVHRVFAHR